MIALQLMLPNGLCYVEDCYLHDGTETIALTQNNVDLHKAMPVYA